MFMFPRMAKASGEPFTVEVKSTYNLPYTNDSFVLLALINSKFRAIMPKLTSIASKFPIST